MLRGSGSEFGGGEMLGSGVLNGAVHPRPKGGVVLSRPAFFQTCPAAHGQGLGPHRRPGEMSHARHP